MSATIQKNSKNEDEFGLAGTFSAGFVFVAFLCMVEMADLFFSFFHHSLDIDRLGILPRTLRGLFGIFLAPFLHSGLWHLFSNSLSLIFLLPILKFISGKYYRSTIFKIILLGGIGVWLFGSGKSTHIGASGLVYGAIAYIVVASITRPRLSYLLIGLAVAIFNVLPMLIGLLPRVGISWSSHFFGMLAGAYVAFAGNPKNNVAV